jgi:hypothetical protein
VVALRGTTDGDAGGHHLAGDPQPARNPWVERDPFRHLPEGTGRPARSEGEIPQQLEGRAAIAGPQLRKGTDIPRADLRERRHLR